MKAVFGFGAVVAVAFVGWQFASAQMMGHDQMHARMHGPGGMGHDETTMPGLRGLNASPEESEELAVMFRDFQSITRTVENLPNGIRTVTSSTNPDVMAALVSHVVGMIDRVEAKDDPQIMIQSPTLDIFFERAERLETTVDVTDDAIVVLQTSTDPQLVEAMHKHAAEVSDMALRGMDAVHDMMMQRMGG